MAEIYEEIVKKEYTMGCKETINENQGQRSGDLGFLHVEIVILLISLVNKLNK